MEHSHQWQHLFGFCGFYTHQVRVHVLLSASNVLIGACGSRLVAAQEAIDDALD